MLHRFYDFLEAASQESFTHIQSSSLLEVRLDLKLIFQCSIEIQVDQELQAFHAHVWATLASVQNARRSAKQHTIQVWVVAAVALCKCSNGKVEKALAALGIGKGEIFT
jgi:hypothetical protein